MDKTCAIGLSSSRAEWLNSVTGCTDEAVLDGYSRRSSYGARRQSEQTLKKLVAARAVATSFRSVRSRWKKPANTRRNASKSADLTL